MKRYRDWRPTALDCPGLAGDAEGIADWWVLLLRSRDSGCLDESNFAAALDRLGGESETVQVHRFGHWACGWFEVLLASPEREEDARAILDRLDEHPVLDEDDFARREDDAAFETWARCYSVSERIRWMRDRDCEPAESFAELRSIARGEAMPSPANGDLSSLIG